MPRNFSGSDRRRFSRILYDAPCCLSDAEKTWQAELIDLSLHGCLLTAPKDWSGQSRANYYLKLRLNETVEIRMHLTLVRSTSKQIAFVCEHIDLDSICALRRLVELNLGDSALLERDLNALTSD